jgi:hypothetical protein
MADMGRTMDIARFIYNVKRLNHSIKLILRTLYLRIRKELDYGY